MAWCKYTLGLGKSSASPRERAIYLMTQAIRLMATMWQRRCREVWAHPAGSWQACQRDQLLSATQLSRAVAQDADAPSDGSGDGDDTSVQEEMHEGEVGVLSPDPPDAVVAPAELCPTCNRSGAGLDNSPAN